MPEAGHDEPVPHADLGAHGVLDPEIATILRLAGKAGKLPYWQLTAEQARIAYAGATRVLAIAASKVHRIETIELPAGATARLYWPREPSWTERMPALAWLHGGGFTVGSVETTDVIARRLCTGADCAVLSIDYRRAPEHRFPVAADDAFDGLAWLHAHAGALGLDDRRIAVGGESAGGTLAAAAAIRARDDGLPLAMQLLVYPGTAAHQASASHRRYADDLLIPARTIEWFFSHYLRSEADRHDWRFAPLEAASLAGLAPAWIAVAEFDPLVDEGVAYARRLASAGVPVTLRFYPGMVHAFFEMGGYVAMARRAHGEVIDALVAAFAKGAS